jgi:ATP synthase subunit 6
MLPFSFTITAQIIQTFSLGLIAFLGIHYLGLKQKKFNYYNIFFPKDVPAILSSFLFLIEIVSYVARVFSLSIRLFANMMSGHTLLNILASFAVIMLKKGWFVLAIIPIFVIIAVISLEFIIAILQAYVFTVLIIIYLTECYKNKH